MRTNLTLYAVLSMSVASLLAAGCGEDRDPISSAGPAQAPSAQGVQFLSCPVEPLAVPLGGVTTSKLIRAKDGGDVDVGKIKIKIPKDALPSDMLVTMTLMSLETMNFRVEPAATVLASPMQIEMDDMDKTDLGRSAQARICKVLNLDFQALATTRDGNKALAPTSGFGDFTLAEVDANGQPVRFIRYLGGPGYATKLIKASDGGDVEYGRHKVKFPKNALSQDTFITVREPGNGYLMCLLEPHGIQFLLPVELEMKVDKLNLNPYTDWTIFWLNDVSGVWEDQGGVLDGDKLKASLSHFSTYGGGRAGW